MTLPSLLKVEIAEFSVFVIFKKIKFFLKKNMCICSVSAGICACGLSWGSGRGTGFSRAEVTGGWEPPDVGAGH